MTGDTALTSNWQACLRRSWSFLRAHPDACALLAVCLVALSFRLSFSLRVAPFVSKDSQSYFLPAWDLVHGGDFQLGLRRTPGYPAFLALCLMLFGEDLRGISLAQHLLGAGTAALTCLLGRLTFGRLSGIVGGLLVGLSAPLLTYEHYLLTEAVFGFVLTAALVTLAAAWHRSSARLWLLGGLLVGLASLVRPIGQLLLPLGLLAAALVGPRQPRPALARAGLVLAGFAILVVPWTIRNQLAYHLATASTFGRTLIARTAYYDHGFVFYDAERPPEDADPRRAPARRIVQQGADRRESDGGIAQRLRQELDLHPVEVNAIMRDVAIDAIIRQPIHFVEGTLRFALRIFNGVEIRIRDHDNERRDVVWEDRVRMLLVGGPQSEDDFRAASRLLNWYQPARYAPLQLVLFSVGLLAAVLVPAWRAGVLVGLAVVGLIVVSAALDGPQERYRYPADPAIGVLAAGGVVAVGTFARLALSRLRLASPPSPLSHQGRGGAHFPFPPAWGKGPGDGGRSGVRNRQAER